jgi:hypothetical protein
MDGEASPTGSAGIGAGAADFGSLGSGGGGGGLFLDPGWAGRLQDVAAFMRMLDLEVRCW